MYVTIGPMGRDGKTRLKNEEGIKEKQNPLQTVADLACAQAD